MADRLVFSALHPSARASSVPPTAQTPVQGAPRGTGEVAKDPRQTGTSAAPRRSPGISNIAASGAPAYLDGTFQNSEPAMPASAGPQNRVEQHTPPCLLSRTVRQKTSMVVRPCQKPMLLWTYRWQRSKAPSGARMFAGSDRWLALAPTWLCCRRIGQVSCMSSWKSTTCSCSAAWSNLALTSRPS